MEPPRNPLRKPLGNPFGNLSEPFQHTLHNPFRTPAQPLKETLGNHVEGRPSLEALLRRSEQGVRRGRIVPGVPQAYKVVAAEAGRPLEEIIFLSARLAPHGAKSPK